MYFCDIAMDIKPSRLVGDKGKDERGGRHVNNMVCSFWLRGRCNRNPCRYLHQDLPQNAHYQISNQFRKNCWQRNPDSDLKSASTSKTLQRSSGSTTPKCSLASNQSHGNNRERRSSSGNGITQKVIGDRVCKYRLHGNCVEADKCRYLHSWFKGHGVFELAELSGHIKNGTIYAWKPKKETNAFELATTLGGDNGAVVSLTVGGGRLYSGSMDNPIRKENQYCCALAMTILFGYMNYHREFTERARIFAKEEVREIQIGPGEPFFHWGWNWTS
ncbi:hypothetical protein AAG906_025653 [Vitis piasezkii]